MKKILIHLFLIIPIYCFAQSTEQGKTISQFLETGIFTLENSNIVSSIAIENNSLNVSNKDADLISHFLDSCKSVYNVIVEKETEAMDISMILWYGRIKLNHKYHAFFKLHIINQDGRFQIVNSSTEIIYNPEGNMSVYRIVDFAPFTERRFRNKEKETEAFILLVTKMNAINLDIKNLLTSTVLKN